MLHSRSGLEKIACFAVALSVLAPAAFAAQAQIEARVKDPYLGAIAIDATTGKVLVEDNADAKGYPASMLKLMVLLLIIEKLEAGDLKLSDKVNVTAEAARMGGSQVYLAEKEVFTVDDLLYALMVQSANDAAVALAIHVAGSTGAFVELMNKRAEALGLKSTEFHSVHGLPPARGQKPDVTTPREMALLAREVVKHARALVYTSTKEKTLRADSKKPFVMRTHNHLLGAVEGCDGLKTGYFRAAGYSICATAQRGGKRVIAVVMGSKDRKTRDLKARELIAKSFALLGTPASSPTASAR